PLVYHPICNQLLVYLFAILVYSRSVLQNFILTCGKKLFLATLVIFFLRLIISFTSLTYRFLGFIFSLVKLIFCFFLCIAEFFLCFSFYLFSFCRVGHLLIIGPFCCFFFRFPFHLFGFTFCLIFIHFNTTFHYLLITRINDHI